MEKLNRRAGQTTSSASTKKIIERKQRRKKNRAVELRDDYRVSTVPAAQNPEGSNPSLNLNLNPAPGFSYFRLLWKH